MCLIPTDEETISDLRNATSARIEIGGRTVIGTGILSHIVHILDRVTAERTEATARITSAERERDESRERERDLSAQIDREDCAYSALEAERDELRAKVAEQADRIEKMKARLHEGGLKVAELQALVEASIPLSALRPIAVEAIRDLMGCPDVVGKDGRHLTDALEETAAAAARIFADSARAPAAGGEEKHAAK